MRVLRISHSGVVTAWRQRERELWADGVAVTVATARQWSEGGSMVRFSADGDDFAVPVRTVGTHPNLFVYDPRHLWQLMGGGAWDLIDVAEEPYSLATLEILLVRALRARRTPFVVISAQNLAKRFPPPFRWTERWALRSAAGAYVCNAAAGEILRDRGLRGPLALLPLGVDLDRFAPEDRGPPGDTLRVGYVGRLTEEKGVAVLLEAVREEPSIHLDVTGDGPEARPLADRAAAADLRGRVTFQGFLDEEKLPAHYRSLDVTVVPSVPSPGWIEQFCRVAVESMASGVPVVASHTGALPEVVGRGGILVPPNDPAALRNALRRLAGDPVLWAELRRNALAEIDRFSWTAVARDQHRLYRRALPGPSDPGDTGRAPRGLTVVVVAYGAPESLDRCLTALDATYPVVVVDNSSSRATADVAASHRATYVDPHENLGFAAGVNRALATMALDRSDVLLLNPDAAVQPAAVETLRSLLADRPRLAAVAPAQHAPGSDRSDRVLWPFPSPWGTWIETLGLGRLRSGRRHGFVIGSVLLLRGEALIDVGGFDERFFLYDEETDWQRRAVRRGWEIAYSTDAEAQHEGAGTDDDPTRRELRFHAGTERYVRKWYGPGGWWVARAGTIAGAALRAAVLPGDRGRAAARRARLFLAGPDREALRRGVVPPARPHVPDLRSANPP